MKKTLVVLASTTAVAMLAAVPVLAFDPQKGPPTRGYYAGGSGNGMKVRLVIQLPYTIPHGPRNPAFVSNLTLRDCHGSHQFVVDGGTAQVGYPHGAFTDSGRGAVISHYNGQEPFLNRYEHVTASGTINGRSGSVTYKIAGCPQRHFTVVSK